jgi:hypothetical protein
LRGTSERYYQSRSNLTKDENSDLIADSQNILNRWKYYFFQLLNVQIASDVRQIEILQWTSDWWLLRRSSALWCFCSMRASLQWQMVVGGREFL